MTVEEQSLEAIVEVRNEVQVVHTAVDGIDEIQSITTSCDDVVAEV